MLFDAYSNTVKVEENQIYETQVIDLNGFFGLHIWLIIKKGGKSIEKNLCIVSCFHDGISVIRFSLQ